MDRTKTEFVDKTILNTPKPTACSTIAKKSYQKKRASQSVGLESSLGLLDADELQNGSNNQIHTLNTSDLSYQLREQRQLANSSLQRANKVAGLPSKYLKPNTSNSSFPNLNFTNESTMNESDLTKSPRKFLKETSTPRTSMALNNSEASDLPRLSLGQSVGQLSYKLRNTDISLEEFAKEFQKTMNSVDKAIPQIDSKLFSPAEEAQSMLLADELSWRKQNEMPLTNNFSQVSNRDVSYGELSMGAFFQQKSDTLSDFKMALSPEKSKNPVPLIDSSISFAEDDDKGKKSLSISAIKKLLAETEDTPRKVTSYLLKQGQRLSDHSAEQSSLPVSKNSSYTSSYSDNEAMRNLVGNKENINSCNVSENIQKHHAKPRHSSDPQIRPLSQGSTRSLSSALTSLPNGKLPIESTKAELIWGCVRVDKSVTQEFLLRNKTPKRLCLQMSIAGYDFKIRKDNRPESEASSSSKIFLHPHESRAIIVSFIPTKHGAAVDELTFTSLDPNLEQTKKQCVRLFGYGGFGKVDILKLTKDSTGKFWLSLGKLDNNTVLSYKFTVKNSGTLPCFACISFNPKQLFKFASITVAPSFSVLLPKEEKEITVTFVLTMDDRQVLLNNLFPKSMVAEIGNLLIISGSEVNRGRLRRQCRKCAEKGLEIDHISSILKEKVKGEIMPSDLNLFKEAPGSLKEILKLFNHNEVVVMIEQDPDVTIMPQYPDESGMFHTLCQDSTLACLETTNLQPSCKLEPASIILIPPTKIKDSLFLISECKKMVHFEVVCNPEGLEVCPKDGIIAPGQETIINLACPKSFMKDKKVFKVLVYVENEVFEATVKINFIHSQNQRN